MSTPDKAPLVEVRDAFEDDYFVGPPPSTAATTGQSTISQEDNSIAAIRKRQLNAARIEQMLANDSRLFSVSTNVPPSEPISYTPTHPTLFSNKPAAARPKRAPQRRALNQTGLNDLQKQLQPPTTRPALATNSSSITRPTLWNRFTTPNILSTPIQRNNTVYQPLTNQSQTNSSNNNAWSNSLPQPRFGSAPNFTTFASATTPEWQSQYLNLLAHKNQPSVANNVPMPAHAHSTTRNVNLPRPPLDSNLPTSAHSNPSDLRAPIPRLLKNSRPQPAPRPSFPSQAVPVRLAYDDFLRQIQNALPNLDVNQFIQQLTSSPNQPIQISVPNGVDTMAVQQQLQKALETTMLQSLARSNIAQKQPQPQAQLQQPIPGKSGSHLSSPFDGMHNGNFGTHHHPDMVNNAHPSVPAKPPPNEDDMAEQDEHAGANQDEEYHEVETYADYVPAKLTIGLPHPDPVVETSSLSTVEAPDIYYKLKLPSSIIDKGLLSALQLESVIYACQQHSQLLPDERTRQGFLIGDGAGVGKGRTIAGIIYENFLCGRKKSIWLSVSSDLKFDAERDLKDIGAKIPVHLLGKFQYGRRINEDFGVIFTTYSGLVSKSQSVRGSLGSRIGQLISWAGSDFEGVIVFDECHKAKNIAITNNAKQSKAATFALDLQNKLPKARVVYASATGASETRHLGYMNRLGIWGKGTAYETFSQFCGSIEKRGVGAMELVAVDLKMRGSYIARQLSFKTTSFEIHIATLDQDFVNLYNECVDMWSTALRFFTEASNYLGDDKRRSRSMWATFWSAHQKFFKYLCIGAKVPLVTQIAKQALDAGKCVVIGLQSTGEAKAMEALESGDINEFISTARATFESLIENHFPVPRGASSRRPYPSPKVSPVESNQQSDESTPSSESTIDTETWVQKDSVAFVMEDGIVKARFEDYKTRTVQTRFSKTKQMLQDLVKEQKSKVNLRTTRAMRAKKRQVQKQDKARSRIKKIEDDSDTEISNPLSSSNSESHLESRTNSSADEDGSDESCRSSDFLNDDDEDETLTECDESDLSSVDEKPKISNKIPVARKKIEDASEDSDDSDVVITAVKPRKNYEVIMLSSDEDEEEDEKDPVDPMVVHGKRLTQMRDELYRMIDQVGPKLPNNTLDDLIDRLGGASKVAEMTGRKGRIVKDASGRVLYRQRNDEDALENLNIAEKERFMKGQKLVAIISEAASSGISLQADKRVANKRRRVHITIELPWSADRAIQQFGRTHRSNQLSGPEYVFVISELAGEKRFASIVAKRLESLGALTHGDRRATTESRDLSQFNLNSKYTRDALKYLVRFMETGLPLANIRPEDPNGTFLKEAKAAFVGAGLGKNENHFFNFDSNAIKLNHFLNRLLGMKVHIQNAIFKLFTDYMDRLIARDKVIGQHDAGILELNSESGKTKCDPPENFELDTKLGRVKCSLWHVQVERGISWEEAIRLKEDSECLPDNQNGFYISDNPLTGARMILLAVCAPDVHRYKIYKPNTGRMPKMLHITDVSGVRVNLDTARALWDKIFTMTDRSCIHMCLFNKCTRVIAKMKCDVGLRHRKYCILSGGILTAWPYLELKAPTVTAKLQIVRLKLDTTNRVIGPVVPQEYVRTVRSILLNVDEAHK